MVPTDRTDLRLGGRYRILGSIGVGAMASVYEGIDEVDQRKVAIKVLKSEVRDRSTYMERFEREVLISAKINHPNVIRIFDFGTTSEDLPYQVMELVPGRPLSELLDEEERLEPIRALEIFKQLLRALSALGDAGVIHRDIKPENLLIYEQDGKPDQVKLIDFGISKLVGQAAVGHEKLTSVGLILGTPHYIAPEWVTRDDVDARSDLYSASIMLFEMLTSAPPFLSEDRKELMKMHLKQDPPKLKERAGDGHFSEALERLVRKGLAKDPDKRYRDARAYLKAVKKMTGETLSNDELKVRSKTPTAKQEHSARVPPGPLPGVRDQAPPALAPMLPAGPASNEAVRIVTVPPRRRPPTWALAAGLVAIIGVAVFIATLPGKKGKKGAVATEDVVDASVPAAAIDAAPEPEPEPEPEPVEPLTDAHIEKLLAAFKDAGLAVQGFEANKAAEGCRVGRVDGVRVYVCLGVSDPIRAAKPMRRKMPGDGHRRKWRGRIKHGDLHLRVENVKGKKRESRRTIESLFKAL